MPNTYAKLNEKARAQWLAGGLPPQGSDPQRHASAASSWDDSRQTKLTGRTPASGCNRSFGEYIKAVAHSQPMSAPELSDAPNSARLTK